MLGKLMGEVLIMSLLAKLHIGTEETLELRTLDKYTVM